MKRAGKSIGVDLADLALDRELYFETCLKIIPKDASRVLPLVMKKEQRRLAALIDHERRQGRGPKIVILKARKIGASTLAEAELFKECHLRPNKQALVVAHKAESAQTIFNMSQFFYDNLPDSVKPPRRYATKRLIHFKHNNSKMQVEVAGEARGFTAQYLHISELGFMDNAERLMTAILSTVGDHVDSLVIAESTPNGIGNYFHNLWVNAVAGRSAWVPFFSPWFEDETYVMTPWFSEPDLSPHDQKLRADHGLSLEQIAWYMNKRADNFLGDQDLMDQEFPSDPISCFLASGRKVFDADGLRHYLESAEAATAAGEMPLGCELEENPHDRHAPVPRVTPRGRWRIYRPPIARHRYIVGADLASGDPGGDWTPIVILNQHTLDVDAVGALKIPPELVAKMSEMIGYWYNTARIAGEANNHGLLYFDELIRRLKYPNIYYRKVSEESVSGKISDKPGVWTSENNRDLLGNLVRRYVRERSGRCLDPDLLREWTELHYDESNRIQCPKGGSKDFTMALAMALYVHCGSLDAALSPLTVEQASRATAIYRLNLVKRSMGIKEERLDLADMTMDEIQRLDEMTIRRRESRERSGLGGYR